MKLNELAVDPERQEKGAWVDDIPECGALRLKVRGSQNADWRRMQAKLVDAIPRQKKLGGRIDPDEQDRLITSLLLNTCLLDWEGLDDEQGNPVPYDKDTARMLLTEPMYRRFREGVQWAANIVAEITDIDQKDAAGNLVRLSPTSEGGEPRKKAG